MPLPLIVAVPALASAAGVGVKKGVDGVSKVRRAQRLDQDTRARYERRQAVHKGAEEACEVALRSLAVERQAAFEETMPRFIAAVSRLRHAEVVAEAFEDRLHVEDIPPGALHEIALKQTELLGSAAAGVIGGVAASQAATFAVTTFAAASTGTAISGLSGVAATNATLAWLGGGTLASGGMGMAGGSMVLGGVTVAPAVLVGGLLFDLKASKLLEQATTNAEEVDSAVTKLDAAVLRLSAAKQTADDARPVLQRLRGRVDAASGQIDAYADDEVDVRHWSSDRQQRLRAAANLAAVLVALAAAPLIADDGGIDPRFTAAARAAHE